MDDSLESSKPSSSVSGAAAARQFRNSQEYLDREAPRAVAQRKQAGLEGLVGDMACVIIMVEPDRQSSAAQAMQHYTGMELTGAYEGPMYVTAVLSRKGSADVLIRSRKEGVHNPFIRMNDMPKSRHLPNTRLETFVFECTDLPKYVQIQKGRGVKFVSDIIQTDTYSFIQTVPSSLIGASYGLIQWHGQPRTYSFAGGRPVQWNIHAAQGAYRRDIGKLDHVATRVHAQDRDAAILEFLRLTNHSYCFSIYVQSLNSITNVTRRSQDDVGLVFTSGIAPYVNDEVSGPTEKFVHNYGPRTHHMAFATEDIERTFEELKADGMTFMVDLVGGPAEGLHQTFTNPSPDTMIVTEYIHRYGGFTGYFTLSNVTALTQATARQ